MVGIRKLDGVHLPRRLSGQVCDALRLKHYSCGTEQVYVEWI